MISFLSNVFFREINFKKFFWWNWFHWCCAATEIYLPILLLRSFFPWNCRPRHKTWGLFARRRARYISFLTLKSVHSNYYYSLKKKWKQCGASLYIIMPRNNRWCERGLLDSLIFESEAKKIIPVSYQAIIIFVWYCKKNLNLFYALLN